ncbi:transposase family protein [uncultured Deinococcus sp.]|uniref:transposase family protein n=1 Tax=uncultured Deinococcus sp. TaxID=158789 RepID=UPI0025F738AA|nr:transposase family protein [uncultured Deinococcus sp.]
MLQVQRLVQRPRSFELLCGLNPSEFAVLAEHLEPLWIRAHRTSLLREGRIRRIGAGRQFKLDVPHRLLLTQMCLRHYLPMHLLGVLFDMDAANVCRNIQALTPFLEQALPAPLRPRTLDSRKVTPDDAAPRRRLRTLDDVLEAFPEIADIIIDGTEQPRVQPKRKKDDTPGKKAVGRPKDQKQYFSVKKGTHTLKTQVAVTPDGLVVHLSAPAGGRTHDMKELKQSRLLGQLPRGSQVWGNRGYTGLDNLCPEHEVITPQMRPRGGTLSEEQRELNHHISKVGITVENVVCKIKKFRICREFYRNELRHHGQFWGCVAGLVNLRTLGRAPQFA